MKKIALTLASAVVSATAFSDTVAWYHFDECAPGTMTTESNAITNSVDPTFGIGTPMYYWNGNKGTSVDYMPAYSNAFPKGFVWADQVTGAKGSLNRCLYVVNPPKRGEWGNGEHGIVKIADDERFHLQSFTIEMFIKDMVNDDEYELSKGQWTDHVIIGKKNSWTIAVSGGSGNGSNTMDWWVYRDNAGTPTQVGWSGTNGNQKPSVLRDGRWHHLAITVDGSDQKAVKIRYYIDYCEMLGARTDMQGPLYYDESPITIGIEALGTVTGGWNGLIDELRISDKALQPSEFLRYCSLNADEDTAVYFSYDFFLGNPFFKSVYGLQLRKYVNEVFEKNPTVWDLQWRENSDVTKPEYVAESAGSLRSTLAAPEMLANDGSIRPKTNSYHQALAVTMLPEGGQKFYDGDSTIEMFLKLDELPTAASGGEPYLFRGVGLSTNSAASWYARITTAGKVYVGLNWQKTVTSPTAALADLDWHHVALVTRQAAKSTKLYVDYRPAGEIVDDLYIDGSGREKGEVYLYCYQGQGWSAQSLKNCLLDDVRITRRALDPQEFLTTRPVATTIANVRFENDFNAGPYYDPVPQGVVSSGTAEFISRVAAKKILDGNGNVVAETNSASLRLSGGVVDFGRNLPLEKASEMTVEFLLKKASVAAGGAEIMHLGNSATNEWSLSLAEGGTALVLKSDVSGSEQTLTFPVAEWQLWNHFAFTFAKDGANTTVTCYQNGLSPVEKTLTGQLGSAVGTRFTIGSAGFNGAIDELRVSPSILSTDKFMVCPEAPGMLLMLK